MLTENLPEKRKCAICGMFFPKDGKRTVCSAICYEYRRKFVFSSWKKKPKICKICNEIIKDPERKTLCSPQCVYISEANTRKKHYERNKVKLRRNKNTSQNNKRGKRLRALDKIPQTTQKTKSDSPYQFEHVTPTNDSLTCTCIACQNRTKKIRSG